MPLFRYLLLSILASVVLACGADMPAEVEQAYKKLPDRVDFNQHIRPILSDRCWSCHGPDEESRQAGLRLDTEAGAFASLESGTRAFVPGKPGASEAIARMISDDPELVMPVPESKMTVSAKEIA
ncbi:MAG: c-type cytochrome domain-containing protein, partial [Bacteroidota bacterium]